jgi:hypothetical protein
MIAFCFAEQTHLPNIDGFGVCVTYPNFLIEFLHFWSTSVDHTSDASA